MRIIYAIILALILAFPASAQRTPKTITADTATAALLWPTNLWSAERANIYSSLGLWTGATNQTAVAWRASLGLSENTTNSTALGWRSAIGVAEIATNSTAALFRPAIGVSEFATNTTASGWRSALAVPANSGGFLTNATLNTPTIAGGYISGSDMVLSTNIGLTIADTFGDAKYKLIDGRIVLSDNWPVLVNSTTGVAVSNTTPSAGAIMTRDTADYRYGIPTTYSKTGLVQAASAAVARNALGFDAAAPGAIGTNLVTTATAAAARSALGLGEWTTNSSAPGGSVTGVVAVVNGGTGGTNAAQARTAFGFDAGAPGAIGTNLLTLGTGYAARAAIGGIAGINRSYQEFVYMTSGTIGNALAGITQAHQTNRVALMVPNGTYTESFTAKEWVDIIGESRDGVVITYGGSNDTVVAGGRNTMFANLTIRHTGTFFYPVHIDGTDAGYAPNGGCSTIFYNCWLDADSSSKSAVGIGQSAWQRLWFVDCKFTAAGTAAFFIHNQASQSDAVNCVLVNCTAISTSGAGIQVSNLGSGKADAVWLIGGTYTGSGAAGTSGADIYSYNSGGSGEIGIFVTDQTSYTKTYLVDATKLRKVPAGIAPAYYPARLAIEEFVPGSLYVGTAGFKFRPDGISEGTYFQQKPASGTAKVGFNAANNGNGVYAAVDSSTGGSVFGGISAGGYAVIMGGLLDYPVIIAQNSAERARFTSSLATFATDVKSTGFRVTAMQTAPSSASDTGTAGEVRVTAGYIYVCTAANTWVRAALSTW